MANFFVRQEGGSAVDIESTYNLRVIKPKPVFVEQPKDLFKRSWADEDGDDVYIPLERKMKSREFALEVYCSGNTFLQDYRDFCILLSEKGFDYWDVDQNVKVACVMSGQEIVRYNQVENKLIGRIIILNKTGKNGSI
jgi:hypothetical protein